MGDFGSLLQVDVTLSTLLGHPTEQGTYQSHNQQQSHRLQAVRSTAALRQAAAFNRQQIASAPSKLQGFDDPQLAFSAKSTAQLMQSLAVFRTCSVKPFVQNADSLLAAAKTLVGPSLVTSVVRNTFFKQFCGGECFFL